MGFFDRFRKSPAADVSLDSIVERARSGDVQGAYSAMAAKLDAMGARSGRDSPAYAAVLYEHASLCLFLDMRPRAIQSLRSAVAITGPAEEDEKNRLTYLMNLAEALALGGQLDEAMSVARDGLAERERFYGREHPGYAYGLETVATVALAQGQYDEALKHAQPALAIYDQHGHSRVPFVWSLLFMAAEGAKASWSQLTVPPEMADAILEEIAGQSLPIAPAVVRGAVEVLAPRASGRKAVLRAWTQVVVNARAAADDATHRAALEQVLTLAEQEGDLSLALDGELGLAQVHDKSADHVAAAAGYDRAIARARSLDSPVALCKTLRNAGLYFVEHDSDRGIALLRQAAETAGATSEELARSRIALGIQLQHRCDLVAARPLLVSALATLDPAHPDATCGAAHLRAIDERGSCECQGNEREIYAQVERLVRERLPEGLLEAIELTGGNVSIRVSRAMNDAEARLVADTVDLAMAEMRKRFAKVYG